MERRILSIGRVLAAEGTLRFHPAALDFDAEQGEEVEIAVSYEYEEASGRMEEFTLSFRAEVDGKPVGAADARVQDRPALHDSEKGTLVLPVRFPKTGLVSGRFFLDARYSAGSWSKEATLPVAKLAESGRFLVRVH